MNLEIKTLPNRAPEVKSTADQQVDTPLSHEIEVIEPGTEEIQIGTGKKFGKDSCGY
jgi:hypothetical protein